VAEAGDFVGAVGRVADKHEPARGEADQHQPQQATHELGGRAVGPPPAPASSLCPGAASNGTSS